MPPTVARPGPSGPPHSPARPKGAEGIGHHSPGWRQRLASLTWRCKHKSWDSGKYGILYQYYHIFIIYNPQNMRFKTASGDN